MNLGPQRTSIGCSSFKFKHYLQACTITSGKKLIIVHAKQLIQKIEGDQLPTEKSHCIQWLTLQKQKTNCNQPCGLVCAVLGNKMPPMLFSSITCTLTRMRSPRGFNVLNFGATAVAALTETSDRRKFTAPATWPGLRLTRPPEALRPWNDAILHCPATAVPSCPTVAMAAMSATRICEDGLHENARESKRMRRENCC